MVGKRVLLLALFCLVEVGCINRERDLSSWEEGRDEWDRKEPIVTPKNEVSSSNSSSQSDKNEPESWESSKENDTGGEADEDDKSSSEELESGW